MVPERQTEVSRRIENRGPRPSHAGEVLAARQLFETEGLVRVPDEDRADAGNIFHSDELILQRNVAPDSRGVRGFAEVDRVSQFRVDIDRFEAPRSVRRRSCLRRARSR